MLGQGAAKEAPSLTSVTQLNSEILDVLITSPSPNSVLEVEKLVEVHFQAGGGPFSRFDLYVDSQKITDIQVFTAETTYSGYLPWSNPSPGRHQVAVIATTRESRTDRDQIEVVAGDEATFAGTPEEAQIMPALSDQPTPRPTSYSQSEGGMQIRFVNVSDGGNLPASVDAEGKPWVTARVEVSGGVCVAMQLQEDGVVVEC